MADIRCSHCGKDNPDFFDVCQFCQSPLKPESMLHIGDEPTKKDTGELEEILPEWLKDARQQGMEGETDDDFLQNRSKIQKDEPPDLLAGLMSQSESDEEEVPDWLAAISPAPETESAPEEPTGEEGKSDFFAQLGGSDAQSTLSPEGERAQENEPPQPGMEEQPVEQGDELTDWFSQASAVPPAPSAMDESSGIDFDDKSDAFAPGFFDSTEKEPPVQKEPEDLSWLHELEAASKGTGELSEPQGDKGFDDVSSSSDEDLDWLNALGGTPSSAIDEPAAPQPASSDDDLDWLNKLGGTPVSSSEKPTVPPQAASDDDLDWLDKLGGTPVSSSEEPAAMPQTESSDEDLDWLKNLGSGSAAAFDEPVTAPPPSSDNDLSWLDNLGGTTESVSEQPVSASQTPPDQEDLDWLKALGATESSETSSSVFAKTDDLKVPDLPEGATSKPFRTAPLNELLSDEEFKDTTPDWLKNAMEEPSMPPPGAVTMDWLSEHQTSEESAPPQDEPVTAEPVFDLPLDGSADSAQQDVESLFNIDMPDWLSRETEGADVPDAGPLSTPVDEILSPVELPSWVQAMRPVDSAISEVPVSTEDQVTEREGPLAGFRGVIPFAPIGSSLRPKAFSLKLQVTEEQQASASLLEGIIAGETFFQPQKSAGGVTTQRTLRWGLSALFLIVLSIVIGSGLQIMPILAPGSANDLSGLVAGVPDNAPVLVVIDYEPSFSGELEAAAGPLLDQLALSRRSIFSFISMSPTGSALVDRLMFNNGISSPGPEGLGYQPGFDYFNLGFLPGGSTGVLGFIENPGNDFARFSAVILMTDNAETGRVWVEQLDFAKGRYPEIASQPLIMVSSAQSGPLLQPYVTSGQADIMISGLYDAAKYELVNVSRPGTARAYWDAFGFGLMIAILSIVLGSLWNIFMRMRDQRAQADQG